mgnify:CR=1 FL=1
MAFRLETFFCRNRYRLSAWRMASHNCLSARDLLLPCDATLDDPNSMSESQLPFGSRPSSATEQVADRLYADKESQLPFGSRPSSAVVGGVKHEGVWIKSQLPFGSRPSSAGVKESNCLTARGDVTIAFRLETFFCRGGAWCTWTCRRGSHNCLSARDLLLPPRSLSWSSPARGRSQLPFGSRPSSASWKKWKLASVGKSRHNCLSARDLLLPWRS